jgi:hypothetical protein
VFIEDTLSFKEVHRVHTMEYVFLFFPFLFLPFFFQAHMNIQLDLRFGLPSRDIPPGTTYQNGAFYRPNGHFHRQKEHSWNAIDASRAGQCTLVHSRPSGLLLRSQLGRYAGIPGAPTTSYLLSLSWRPIPGATTAYRSWSRLYRDALHNTQYIYTI